MSSPILGVPKPTIVFVPGVFHTPIHFQTIITLLGHASFPTLAIALPTVGEQAATANYRDDVHIIRGTLKKLVEDENKDVVLAVHSLGGISGCQTVNGLEKSKRLKEGKQGGVVQVLFIAALVVKQNQELGDALEGGLPPWASLDGSVLRPTKTTPIFYNCLPLEQAEYYTSLLQPSSPAPAVADVADVCYSLDVPITYVLGNQDVLGGMLERMMDKVKQEHWQFQKIDGDHCLFLSNPKELVRLIEECLAGATTS